MVQPKEEFKYIESYTIARYKHDFILKLDMNENTLGCSPFVAKKIQSLSMDNYAKYPTYGEIEDKIASFFNLTSDNVLITNGGDAGINSVYITYVDKNDEVIYTVPSYVMYKLDALRLNANIVQVPYEKKWVYPTQQVIDAVTEKTKLIVICSPANPTGDLVPEEDICRILEAAPDAMILLDEAYWRFTDRENRSLTHLLNKYDNLTIMHTFSKDYGLAGIRIGYLLSTPKNIEYIGRSMDPFSVNNIAVEAAQAALEDQHFVEYYVDHVKESRDYFSEAIKCVADEVYESHANFVFFHVGPRYEWYYSKLFKKGIKIRRYPTNPALCGYLRLTLGTIDQMKVVCDCFKDYKVVVLDIDGVMVDECCYKKAIQATFKFFAEGKEVSLEEIQKYKNMEGFINDWKLTSHLLTEAGYNIPSDEVVDRFQEFYWDDGKGFISEEQLLIDVNLIHQLAKNYKLAVFTGRPRAEAEYVLSKHGILDDFSILVCSDDIPEEKGKPNPYGLEKICEGLGSTNVIYLGDMPDDIKAAGKAFVDSVGILPPQDKSAELKNEMLSLGAIEVYDNLAVAMKNIFGILEG